MSAENECVSSVNLEKCAVILLDIAGTTTATSFVKDTLYPFVLSNAEEFLKSNWNEEKVKEAAEFLKDGDEELDITKATEILKASTEKDEDNKGVKILQGLIYKKGYEEGTLKAHVFPDVPVALESWSKNRKIAVYSSGSVESQKLLFAHTTEGDLSTHITHYFDLTVGPKTEASSYEKIAKDLSVTPEEIVFINDNPEEANAAKKAGATVVLIKREGNPELTPDQTNEITVVPCFSDLALDTSGKRKNEDIETTEVCSRRKSLRNA